MAARANWDLKLALIETRKVETGQTVVVGRVVKDGNADGECQHCDDGVDAIGVVIALGPLLGAAGDEVQIAMLCGAVKVKVRVGTGGAVRGKFAKCVADGVTTATPDVATPAGANVVGFFAQSGSAADFVGMYVAKSWLTE